MTEEMEYAESWKPIDEGPGAKISGKVAEIKMYPGGGYGPYPIVTIATDSGERAVHAFHQVLREELARRRPGLGDDIEITYVGSRKPKSGQGQAFHVYKVRGGQAREFNWDDELPEAERQAQQSAPPIDPAPTRSEVVTAAELRDRQEREANEARAAAAEENFGSEVPF